jgi:hypothetical protein
MNLKNLKTEQIKNYIRIERDKGRSMRQIVKEVADARDDFTILSHDCELAKRQILEVLSKTH